jgi:hypothetical protein
MNPANESQGHGICPVCYKPVTKHDDIRTLQDDKHGRKEAYHAACVHNFFSEHSDIETHIGRSLLEENKHLLINNNLERRFKRLSFVKENIPVWQATGSTLKEHREGFGLTLKSAAAALAISTGRLKRFENGFPVKDASLLLGSYISLIHIVGLERRHAYLVQYLNDLQIPMPEVVGYEPNNPEWLEQA